MAKARLVAEIQTKGARKSAKELGEFSKESKKAEKSSVKLTNVLKKAPKAILAVGVAAGTAALAITAMSVKSAGAQRELKTLANVAGESVETFEALAFATNQVGISAEKLSDISKDVNEKLGEFIATGGGGFKDFFEEVAPLVGITADQLQNLSGPEVLQRVKNAMDEANISMEEQSFFLESIASDTTLLIPLLAEEGKQLENLTSRFKEVVGAIQITENQNQGLRDLATTFNLLESQGTKAATSISATLAPTLDKMFESVISLVPQATQAIIDFINSLVDPENLSSIAATQKRIAGVTDEIDRLNKAKDGPRKRGGALDVSDLSDANDELAELNARLVELQENQKKLDDVSPIKRIKTIKGETVDVDSEKSLEQLRNQSDAFLAETNRLGRSRLELINIQESERLNTLREFANVGLIEFTDFEDAKTRILEDSEAQRTAITIEANKQALESGELFFGTMADVVGEFAGKQSDVYKGLFLTQKAFALASAINNIALAQTQAASDSTAITAGQKFANVALITSLLVPIISTLRGNDFSPRQQGGQFSAGQDLLVGEKGPELVRFGSGGRIADARQTAGMGSGIASVTIVNQTQGSIDKTDVSVEDGRMVIIAQQVLDRNVLEPNSPFNKNFDRTRSASRRF
jgi:hypothetical protein